MSRPLRGLGKIFRILNPPSKERSHTRPSSSGPLGKLEGLMKPLVLQLGELEPHLQILDARVPIREGNAKIDLVALGQDRDLIFIWVFERLTEEKLLRVIPDYDWARKNISLFQHFFPIKRGHSSKIKVWLMAGEVAPTFGPLLSYLKEIPFKIFLFQRREEGGMMDVEVCPWEGQPTSLMSSPPNDSQLPIAEEKAFMVAKRPPLLPILQPEEVKDLLGDFPSEGVNDEDEITDPYCPLSELK